MPEPNDAAGVAIRAHSTRRWLMTRDVSSVDIIETGKDTGLEKHLLETGNDAGLEKHLLGDASDGGLEKRRRLLQRAVRALWSRRPASPESNP